MKLWGMLIVLVAGTGGGLLAGHKLRCRAAALELLSRFAEQLAERVRYTAAPLSCLWQEMSEEFERLPLMKPLQEATAQRQDWCAAAEQSAVEMQLNAEDTRLLTEFFRGVGEADNDGEQQRCRQYAAEFARRAAEARATVHKKAPLYVTLGVCGGSMAALILGG